METLEHYIKVIKITKELNLNQSDLTGNTDEVHITDPSAQFALVVQKEQISKAQCFCNRTGRQIVSGMGLVAS